MGEETRREGRFYLTMSAAMGNEAALYGLNARAVGTDAADLADQRAQAAAAREAYLAKFRS